MPQNVDDRSLDDKITDAEEAVKKLRAAKNQGETLPARLKAMSDSALGDLVLEKLIEHLGNPPTLQAILEELRARKPKAEPATEEKAATASAASSSSSAADAQS